GQSVGLCGQPSQVASCFSHSAGIENPSVAGDSSGAFVRLAIKVERMLQAISWQFNSVHRIQFIALTRNRSSTAGANTGARTFLSAAMPECLPPSDSQTNSTTRLAADRNVR